MMSNDMTLVREFAANQSEPAFAALVERHIALIHSAALRQVGDAHLAEEITQAVFIILARKAASLGTKTILSAWLYRTTRYAASDALKARRRRQAREQEAYMQSTLNEPHEDAWAQLAPLLDDALAKLGETDRTALVLRFFENKTAREIAGALRMEEAAAQKRVARALEKLRATFVKRGVALTATAIAGAVAANSVQAAPAGLAVKVSVVAAKGAAVTTSITTIVKGTLKIMTCAKLKLALGITAGILLAGGATTLVISQTSHQPQILIKGLFVKTPTKNVDAILRGFAGPAIPIDPNTEAFRNLIKQQPGVSFIWSPQITTCNNGQAIASSTETVRINSTNANVGTTLDVTPTVRDRSKIALKIQAELTELADGNPPSIRTTKIITQALPCDSGTTICIRGEIGSDGTSAATIQDNASETLLVFVNATLVDKQLNKTVGDEYMRHPDHLPQNNSKKMSGFRHGRT